MKADLLGHSIVVVGLFPPSVFHPIWFTTNDLLRESDVKGANIDLLTNDVVFWHTERISFSAQNDRFSISSSFSDLFPMIRDLAINIILLFPQVPIFQLGMNYDIHEYFKKGNDWQSIRTNFFNSPLLDTILESQRIESIRFSTLREYDDTPGKIIITIEPSVRIEPGFYMGINDHYELIKNRTSRELNSNTVADLIAKKWALSQKWCTDFSLKFFEGIYAK